MDRQNRSRAQSRGEQKGSDPLFSVLRAQIGVMIMLLLAAYAIMLTDSPFYHALHKQAEHIFGGGEAELSEDMQLSQVVTRWTQGMMEHVKDTVMDIARPDNPDDALAVDVPAEPIQETQNFAVPIGSDPPVAESNSNAQGFAVPTGGDPPITESNQELQDFAAEAEGDSLVAEELQGQGGWNPVKAEELVGRKAPPDALLSPAVINARLLLPVEGTVTSPFGYRYHPITGNIDFHMGVDIAAPEKTAILCSLPGTVIEVGESAIYGNYIVVEHSANLKTRYSHCSEIIAKTGYNVRQGERIALVGNTGVSTGPHLHFDVLVNGMYTDPAWSVKELNFLIEKGRG